MWLKLKLEVLYEAIALENLNFFFLLAGLLRSQSLWKGGYGTDFTTYYWNSCEKHYRMCQQRGKLFWVFFFRFIHHQLQVCFCMTPGWIMNSSRPTGTPTSQRRWTCSLMLSVLFFPPPVRVRGCEDGWKKKKKKGLVWNQLGDKGWDTVGWLCGPPWRLGQVLAGWLLTTVSQKTTCWDDSIKGNQPARKPPVITQPAFSPVRVQNEATAAKKEGGKREKVWKGTGGGREGGRVFERCPLHTELETRELSWAPNYSASLCFIVWTWHKWDMAVSIVCITSRVMFSSVCAKQHGEKTVRRRHAATMLLCSSRPNDAVLAVMLSGTKSDNNKLSAAAARNYRR